MKIVLFIPGFMEDISSRNYQNVVKAIREKGYKVEFVDVDWRRKTLTDWRAEFMKIYNGHDTGNTILAGFSFGSMIALTAAEIKNPAELWLFSLSPYFAEDLPKFKKTWIRETGKKRMTDFAKYIFSKIAPNIHCPVLLMVGEIEMQKYGGIIGNRFRDAAEKFTDRHAVVVPKTEHDVAAKNYVAKIKENI